MKTYPLLIVALLGLLALSACDDDEAGSNIPPDLRLEDVVGCWYWSTRIACATQCYDANGYEWNQMASRGAISEDLGVFAIDHFYVIEKIQKKSNSGLFVKADTLTSTTGFRRVDNYLYVLDYEYQLHDRYSPVNLDSAFPCGTPFKLLPKPEGWTLF